MSVIVKSTPEAIEAIASMRSIIDGVLLPQFRDLAVKGDTAGNPANWDGPLAKQFQDIWAATKADLDRLGADLTELHNHIARVQANIQSAGGAG